MIRLTFTAMPRRISVLSAKATVVTGLMLAAGTVASAGSVLAGQLILPGHGLVGPPLSLGNSTDLRAALGSALYLALIALLALGVATLVRDSAAAIGTVLGLLYLFPILAATITDPAWHRHLQQIGPMTAGLDIQATATSAPCRSRPGRASACSPPGPPERSSSAAWRSDSATRDRQHRRPRGHAATRPPGSPRWPARAEARAQLRSHSACSGPTPPATPAPARAAPSVRLDSRRTGR